MEGTRARRKFGHTGTRARGHANIDGTRARRARRARHLTDSAREGSFAATRLLSVKQLKSEDFLRWPSNPWIFLRLPSQVFPNAFAC